CNKRDHAEKHRQTGKTAALEIFAFRRRRIVQAIAHFLGASGLAGDLLSAGLASAGFASAGLFSAGFSKSARCSGGTSTIAALWLRCSARKYAMMAQRSATMMFGP